MTRKNNWKEKLKTWDRVNLPWIGVGTISSISNWIAEIFTKDKALIRRRISKLQHVEKIKNSNWNSYTKQIYFALGHEDSHKWLITYDWGPNESPHNPGSSYMYTTPIFN